MVGLKGRIRSIAEGGRGNLGGLTSRKYSVLNRGNDERVKDEENLGLMERGGMGEVDGRLLPAAERLTQGKSTSFGISTWSRDNLERYSFDGNALKGETRRRSHV